VNVTRKSPIHFGVTLALVAAGFVLWSWHARAWDLGRRSPVLSFDPAQYAVAARELAEHGRLATPFALPIELARHSSPPWPLAVVQPGLVFAEAAVEKLTPRTIRLGPMRIDFDTPARREWLTLLLPLTCFLLLGVTLAWMTLRLLALAAPETGATERALAALAIGGAFLLDPEAQHFAVGGFTELPYTLGVVVAFWLLATGWAGRSPLVFGLLLGATGSFRGNMLWLAPILAAGAALVAPGVGRRRAFALAMLGYAIPLAPWWIYKWMVFGSPAWDLSRLAIWDGVGGRTWFSLTHLPEAATVPDLSQAIGLIAAKFFHNLGTLSLSMTLGPRGLLLGSILVWLVVTRNRALRVAGAAVIIHAIVNLKVAAFGAGWLRYLFPARVPLEAAGLLALWALIGRVPPSALGPAAQRVVRVAVAVMVLGWGALQTVRGQQEASAAAAARALPSTTTLEALAARIARELPANAPVMSNLGPSLAWYARRPVVHLALTPDDLDACRHRLDVRHVLLAFQDRERAWAGWSELLERPDEATAHPAWNVARVERWPTEDGFEIVWLELGPLRPWLASRQRP
jgi:hypothetical protein